VRTSWLIPVRDCERWIAQAVGSALGECGADDEVLVVDDGSTDHSVARIPQDPRIRVLRQPPSGIVTALNRGLAAARGELVARLDADDVVIPGRLAVQREVLALKPGLGAVGGRAVPMRDDGPVPAFMSRYVAWVNGLSDVHREILVESPLFHPATTLRREAVLDVGGYRDGDFPEDYDLFLRLVRGGWGLANLDRPVLRWRDREGRLTRTDRRYRRDAMLPLKQAFLEARVRPGARVGVWGGGKAGRPWTRWVTGQGATLAAVVDRKTGTTRRGTPVTLPADLPGMALDLLLVAVGAPGAREIIREELADLRPDLVEGRDWFAVA
jgi:glycosyltransferase involved in cell wall biosynthesis